MNIKTIVLIIIVLIIAFFAIRSLIRSLTGKSGCGCGSSSNSDGNCCSGNCSCSNKGHEDK